MFNCVVREMGVQEVECIRITVTLLLPVVQAKDRRRKKRSNKREDKNEWPGLGPEGGNKREMCHSLKRSESSS